MDKNIKIARELVKLAKSLVAEENIANQAGEYKDFIGKIQWKGISGTVKNATFELKDDTIIWHNGIWEYGSWYKGTWEDGVWTKGTWEYGTWKNGVWFSGMWRHGIWEGGEWVFGKDGNNEPHRKGDSPDKWGK